MQMYYRGQRAKGSRKDRPRCDLFELLKIFSLLSEWASPNGPKRLDLDVLTIPLWPQSLASAGSEPTATGASPSGKPKRLRSRQADPTSRSMGVLGN